MALDIGIGPFDFWDYTLSELNDCIASFNRTHQQKRKEKLAEMFTQAVMIGDRVALMFAKDATPPKLWDYAPELFESEKASYEAKKQAEYMAEFRAYTERMNKKRRKEGADGEVNP